MGKAGQMLMSIQDAIVFGFENKSWLGNQHGKHTSNIQKHFLCLATGKNLVCFLCFCVMLLWSLELCGGCKRKGGGGQNQTKKLLHWNSGTNLAWKLLCGDLCNRAPCPPVTSQGRVWRWGPSRSQHLVSSSPRSAARDLQHFLFWDGWELTVFMKWTWPRKAFSMIRLCTWKSPQLYFPSQSVWAPVY